MDRYIVVVVLLLIGTGMAEENNFSLPLFTAESVVYTAVNVADGMKTVKHIRNGGMEQGWPTGDAWLIGRHPTPARYAIAEGGIEVATGVIAWKLQHNRRIWVRAIGHGLMAQGVYSHATGVAYYKKRN